MCILIPDLSANPPKPARLEINERLGRLGGIAIAYANLGGIHRTRGDLDQARAYWTKARDLYARVGIPRRVQKMERWLQGLESAEGGGRD